MVQGSLKRRGQVQAHFLFLFEEVLLGLDEELILLLE
jgi:hypothetical protein